MKMRMFNRSCIVLHCFLDPFSKQYVIPQIYRTTCIYKKLNNKNIEHQGKFETENLLSNGKIKIQRSDPECLTFKIKYIALPSSIKLYVMHGNLSVRLRCSLATVKIQLQESKILMRSTF